MKNNHRYVASLTKAACIFALCCLIPGFEGIQAFSQTDVVVLPYMSAGYRYSVYTPSASFPANWQTNTFNDTRWSAGSAGFGTVTLPNTPPCPLNNVGFVQTNWPQSRNMLVRKNFTLPAGANNVRVKVAIDNAVQVFLNGVDISGGIQNHDICAARGDYVFVVPDNLLRVGSNVVAASGLWRSGQSYLDMQVVGDFVKTITATAGPNGAISPSGPVLVNIGSSQSFVITPNPGYHVLDVLVDGVSQGPLTSYTFSNVSGNHTISASFAANTFVVGNTNDSGPGSLRDAIEAANEDSAIDSIRFVFLTPGPHTINLNSPLPELLNEVVIDACTQALLLGSSTPIVEINGNGAALDGLVLSAGNTTICGVVINRFLGSGIVIQSDSNVVIGNRIGTDPTGTIDLGNGLDGIRVLSGNGNRIGGGTVHERNVISGNERNGISLESAGPTLIQNNHIGTDAAGTTALGNAWSGIHIAGGLNHEIGGTPGSGNLISGNGSNGIEMESASGVSVQRNYIGTDVTGSFGVGNVGNGVLIMGASTGNTITGGNVISGNSGAGVAIFDASSNSVKGNRIGTSASGDIPLGNQSNGVIIGSSSSVPVMNTIGGLDAADGNTIAHNGGAGVVIMSGTQHAVLGNSISDNQGPGIDLGGDGVTPNHVGPPVPGPNNFQNHPVLNFAAFDLRAIAGSILAQPLSSYRIEFFSSNSVDASGYGEGERFVGFTTVTTDTAGLGTFYVTVPGTLSATEYVAATATDGSNNTSEFSAAVATVSKVKLFGDHYVVNTTLSGIPLHWPDGIGAFKISNNVPAEFHAPMARGYLSWGELPPLTYIHGGTTDTTTWGGDPDGINNAVWVSDGWEELTGMDRSAIAVTRVRYNSINGQITDADIAIDAEHFLWDATGGDSEAMDMENVMAHEAGHFSGLGDIYNPGDPGYAPSMGVGNDFVTMYGLIRRGETVKRSLEWPDSSGIAYIYNNIPSDRLDLVLVYDGSVSYSTALNAFGPSISSGVELVQRLRHGDRLSIVKMPGTVVFPLTQMQDSTARAQAVAALNGMLPGGQSAIGAGLQTAQAQLDGSPLPDRARAMILFSSGEENALPSAMSVLPSLQAAGTRVFTLGFQGSSGQALANTIADSTGGLYYLAADTIINQIVNQIWNTLLSQQYALFTVVPSDTFQNVPQPGLQWQGPVDNGAAYLLPGLQWQGRPSDPTVMPEALLDPSSYVLSLLPPGGTTLIDSAYVAEHPELGMQFFGGPTYQFFKINRPVPGIWTMFVYARSISSSPEPVVLSLTVFTDITMAARFNKIAYDTNEVVQMSVALSEGGQTGSDKHVTGGSPVTNATVKASVVPPVGAPVEITLLHVGGGVYSGMFNQTQLPGTYGFTFTARRDDFERVSAQAVYVVDPNPPPPPPSSNLIVNPGFEEGQSPWSFFTNGGGTYSLVSPGATGNSAARISIASQGSDLQFYQSGFTLKLNTRYRLSFKAYSNNGRDLSVFVQRHTSPGTGYGLSNVLCDLTKSWSTFSMEFVATSFAGPSTNDTRLRFRFNGLANPGTVYYLDDIVLEEAQGVKVSTAGGIDIPEEFSLAQNYPNPFNPVTTISLSLPEDARVTLDVYNVLGERVAQLLSGPISAGHHVVDFDGRDLASGVYFYRASAVTASGEVFTFSRKMVLMK